MRNYVNLQIALFTPAYMERYRSTGLESDLPLFIVGLLRSGTTLAEQILSSHSGIGGSGEQWFWSEHYRTMIDWRTGTLQVEQVRALATKYVALLERLCPGHRHVIDKNPSNSLLVGELHLAFPNSRIVRMKRNALDNAFSIWTTHMQTGAEFVFHRENIVFAFKPYARLMSHWESVLPESRYRVFSYESLAEHPLAVTRDMIEFIGLDWETDLEHPERNSHAVRTPSFWQVRQPINTGSVERWRRYEPWLGPFEELRGL